MDPYLNSQAYKILAETMSELKPTQSRANQREWGNCFMRELGGLLVALGQKMQTRGRDVQAAFEDAAYPSLEDEVCIN